MQTLISELSLNIILGAGTSKDTVNVNLNKTIKTFQYLPPPPPTPCKQCDLAYNKDYSE